MYANQYPHLPVVDGSGNVLRDAGVPHALIPNTARIVELGKQRVFCHCCGIGTGTAVIKPSPAFHYWCLSCWAN